MNRFTVRVSPPNADFGEFFWFDCPTDVLEFIENKIADNYVCTLSHADNTNLYEAEFFSSKDKINATTYIISDSITSYINQITYSAYGLGMCPLCGNPSKPDGLCCHPLKED